MTKKLLPSSTHSLVALISLCILVFAKLFLINYYPALSSNTKYRLEVIYIVATVLVCCAWMFRDRARLGGSFVSLGPALAAFIWPIGLPLYLVSTRGVFGLSKVLAAVLLLASFALFGGFSGRAFQTEIETEQAASSNR